MSKNHLKPQHAPTTWTIQRKTVRYVTRPNAGAHSMDLSMPINLILKNLLKIAKTNKEVKKILHEQEVLVDGTRRKDYRYPMGLMDVLSIPKIKESYVMLLNEQNKLFLQQIYNKDSSTKISKITGKKILKKGVVQLKTLDGRTLKVKKDTYKTGESIVITIPGQEIKETLKLEKGTPILMFRGRYAGSMATIVSIEGQTLKFMKDSKEFETKKSYAIAIGKDKPLIKIQ
ncbi:MAG: 30S ribosomal protein S4e [archaeon]